MNHLTSLKPNTDKVENVRQVQQETSETLIGSKRIHKGHTLFEVNVKEQTIVEAQFEECEASYEKAANIDKPKGFGVQTNRTGTLKRVILDAIEPSRKKVIKKENCIYISALNKKNLLKKLEKRGVIKIN
ncbi:hypothetical protein [Gaetbulibacter sp. PBL-D1]|uniref:hypothetical protein n=1 Tax=Gaetbulibacter sp. PBL-D1 TaxID=3422594 RepID=UPI003D2F4740